MKQIDLNADLGEGAGTDLELLQIVSSASIACGGHAGDENTMRTTLRAAKRTNVVCGAHPGFVDPAHFGRRRLNLSPVALKTQIDQQLQTLQAIADAERVPLKYVKLHGALANMAASDQQLGEMVFARVKAHNPQWSVLALDNSAQVAAASALGLKIVREAYVDRAYSADGQLVRRDQPGAVVTEVRNIVAQCLRLAQHRELMTAQGETIRSDARSLCLHGDTPGAVILAKAVRDALNQAEITITSPL